MMSRPLRAGSGSGPRSRPWRRSPLHALLLIAIVLLVATNAPALHLLGFDPIRLFPAQDAHRTTHSPGARFPGAHSPAGHPPVVAVFFSGDMGFHFGMGVDVAEAIAERGVPVLGVSSPVVFARHRTRAQTDAIVADAIRMAMARTGAGRVLLMGHSYGADILATAAPGLPPDLRSRVVAIDLAVPARDVYFRADPSSLAYLGRPDALPVQPMRALDWAPVICLYGVEEKDSLCPALKGTRAHVIALPGNHHLQHDRVRLIATTLAALRLAAPETGV